MKRPVGCSLLLLALLMLGLPVLIFGVRARQAEQQAARRAAVELYTVGRGDVDVSVSALGSIAAETTASLSFATAGRIAEVRVQPGDAVAQGELIARLDDRVQQLAYDQALLTLQMAELRKTTLLAGPDEGQIAVAEANIAAARGAYFSLANAVSADDIRAAELAVQQAETALADAQRARATAPGDQPEAAYALLDARVGQASFNVEIARLQLEALRGGSSSQLGAAYARIEQAQAELERLLAGPTQSQIDSADAAIAQAQAAVDRAASALADTLLTAPFDGVITSLTVEVGALAAPGVAVGVIADLQPLRIEVSVDEIDVRQIAEGMSATVSFDALPDVRVSAQVERIALIGVESGGIISYPVVLRLAEDADARVRIGLTAEARLIVESRQDVLVVPNVYIRLDRQRDRAFVNRVAPDGTLEEIEITLGLRGDDVSEVIAGLEAGTVIAVDLGGDRIPAFGG